MASRDLIKKGIARRIGNGRTTFIWKDNWIADHGQRSLATPVILELAEAKVVSLMKMEEPAEWDTDILDDLFDPRDKERILKTPISPNYEDDWYWKLDMKGEYTVKSAYRSLTSSLTQNRAAEEKYWTTLWNLKIPEKVKIHWWRIIRGIIPVREILRKRGMDIESACPLCDRHPESINHLFLECARTQDIWRSCNLTAIVGSLREVNCESILGLQDNTKLIKIAGLLWIIWRSRNNVVWRKAKWDSPSISRQIASTVEEWNSVGRMTTSTTANPSADEVRDAWEPPSNGWLKCNFDAALLREDNKVGYGLVLRDDQARFVAAKSGHLPCTWEPKAAEA